MHLEDFLLERLGLEGHLRELVEMGVALGGAADLGNQLQPRLGVARLVLHHRRVVELGLGLRRRREELRRHLDRRGSSAWSCWVITERQTSRRRACRCGEPFSSGIGGSSFQGRSRTCHSARFASS